MTRIDTPFVGGASSPKRREVPDSELARPYSTGEEPGPEAPRATPAPSAAEPEDAWETALDDTLTEAPAPEEELEDRGAAEGPSMPAEAVIEPEAEAASPIEFVEADEPEDEAESTESASQLEAPEEEPGVHVESLGDDFEFAFESSIETSEYIVEESPEELESAVEPGFEESPVSEPATIAPEDVASAMVEPSEEVDEGGEADASTADEGFPDFLFGDDAAAEEEGLIGAAPAEEDDLSRAANELSHGAHADRIRALRESLKDEQADNIVSRAFAAGYLAARDEEQEDR